MSHSRKLSRNVAQHLSKSSNKPVVKRTKPGTPYRRQITLDTQVINGLTYELLGHYTKGVRWERQPLPSSAAGVIG